MGEDDYDDISDEDMDPSPTNPLDTVDPGFRYEPQMVRLERWHYPRPSMKRSSMYRIQGSVDG